MNKFKPGFSGNPHGRPKGAIGLMTRRRTYLEAQIPAIVKAINELAIYGDSEALTEFLKTAIEVKKTIGWTTPLKEMRLFITI